MWTQYVQTNPMVAVATSPNNSPAFMKAKGMANMPEPRLPFSRCMNVSMSLIKKNAVKFNHVFRKILQKKIIFLRGRVLDDPMIERVVASELGIFAVARHQR